MRVLRKAVRIWGEPLYRALVAADLLFISLHFVLMHLGYNFWRDTTDLDWRNFCSLLELSTGCLVIFAAILFLLKKPVYTIVGIGVGLYSIYLSQQGYGAYPR